MGQALYRKYRSRTFGEVVGQEHITKTLSRAIKSGRISHAYLFTGPRGVGKTSVARILAHEVNKLPYEADTYHLDIIEIDAASNRRIDEIRDLRERVRVAPSIARYKVYIIDEVHMLTREAFNALLKTLEEPPAHAIFILATTEAHKLPETIISRTQRFEFKPVGAQNIARQLQYIAKKEKVSIDVAALELLAEFGSGSFRDSISYLDQLSSLNKKVTESDVRDILGLPSSKHVESLLAALTQANSQGVLLKLEDIKQEGANAQAVASALSKHLRQMIVDGKYAAWITELLKELLEISASSQPQEQLEIALLSSSANRADTLEPLDAQEAAAPRGQQVTVKNKAAHEHKQSLPGKETTKPLLGSKNDTDKPLAANFNLDMWSEVVNRSKSEAASIYTALRLAVPTLSGQILTLSFQFPLHQKKLSLAKNNELLGRIIEEVSGSKIEIKCVVDKSTLPHVSQDLPGDANGSLQTINYIFGTTEVVEA